MQLWWLASLDRDLWKLPEAIREYGAAMRRRQQLDHSKEVVLWRTNNQQQLIGELLAGRVSFLQVAACFQFLDENPPEEKMPPLQFPGSTAEEKICRHLIFRVEDYMSCHPETHDQAFLQRLHKELAELLARPERLQLPTAADIIGGLHA